jgi:hypothetical protein
MIKLRLYIFLLIVLGLTETSYSQTSINLHLTEPVKIELNRLDEAYEILDQFAEDVWNGWDDYMNFPFQFTFQNGLRILIGHPAPPPGFTIYPEKKIHGLSVFVDTTRLNDYLVKQPLLCGGGILTLGSFNNQPVTIVDISFISPESFQENSQNAFKAESTIMTFIHELMHCHQPKIREYRYGNLMINPDLNFSLYSDIEGQALYYAYQQSTLNESVPFLVDFCVARSFKLKKLNKSEKKSNACDEFCEGVAVYSEYKILSGIRIRNGFRSSLAKGNDIYYNYFKDVDSLLNIYVSNLKNSTGNTLEVHEKTYWYGLFEALLLQRYFPTWQNDIENGAWLDQAIRKNVDISANDSLQAMHRFLDIYHLDSLKKKHEAVITERDSTFKLFQERKGRIYKIDFTPISQFPGSLVPKSVKKYVLGFTELYPEGINKLKFDDVCISFRNTPVEIDQFYFVNVVDIDFDTNDDPYKIVYKSSDSNGFFYNVSITTPLFTIEAPEVSLSVSNDTVTFTIHSRVFSNKY